MLILAADLLEVLGLLQIFCCSVQDGVESSSVWDLTYSLLIIFVSGDDSRYCIFCAVTDVGVAVVTKYICLMLCLC